jgi:hypothetical protein
MFWYRKHFFAVQLAAFGLLTILAIALVFLIAYFWHSW